MNREIKFRAWHKKYGYMERVAGINFNRERINLNAADIGSFDDIILMQYTGLKDKNGVEIFEGDIVQWCGNKMEIFWGEDIGCGYGFCWRNIKGDSYYHESMTGFIDEYEVIGNIYENPELLEGER